MTGTCEHELTLEPIKISACSAVNSCVLKQGQPRRTTPERQRRLLPTGGLFSPGSSK
jgi:hypothetical protein